MTGIGNRFGWHRAGLRTRYLPRYAICGGVIHAAPWINVGILLVFFLALSSKVVLRSGVRIDLPDATAVSVTGQGLVAVVLSREGIGRGEREETVFFDDDPFAVADQLQMRRLAGRFREAAQTVTGIPLVIEADTHVRYGTISALCNMAREAGFPEVSLAQEMEKTE